MVMPNSLDREAFEAKFAPLGYNFGIDETDGEYLFADTHHAWLGWQAGAAAEREICAKICEEIYQRRIIRATEGEAAAAGDCAEAIRDRSAPCGKT